MTSLINEERLWGSLRRFFDGSVAEVLAELLQNSQRATAGAPPERRVVEIAIPPPGPGPHAIAYRDRGHGIAGIDGLRALLTVADSAFEDPAVALDQHPLGLGFYSLVARAGVSGIELRSGALAFALDTARWWSDAAYRAGWRERVATLPDDEATDGFALRIACDEPTRAAFAAALPTLLPHGYDPRWQPSLRPWPAVGYAGVLDIRVDGAPVVVETPPALALPGAAVVAEYRGCAARVAFADDMGFLTVNWYGQTIVERTGKPWSAYLVVRAGRPLNPRAPTRERLIDDDARRAFVSWVEDRLFAHVAAAPHAAVTPEQLFALHRIDRECFDRECRYAVVERLRPLGGDWLNSHEEVDVADHLVVERTALRDPALPHLLLDREVRLAHRAGDTAAARFRERAHAEGWWADGGERGIASFAGAIGAAILLPVIGATTDCHLWWRPELDLADPDCWLVAGPGSWGLGTRDAPPARWHPFPTGVGPLFVFGDTTGYEVGEVDRTVATPDPVRFLERYGRAFWCPDEEDADASERSYDASVAALIRTLLGDAVPRLPLHELAAWFGPGEGSIARLELRYGEVGHEPTGVVAVSDTGARKAFRFYELAA